MESNHEEAEVVIDESRRDRRGRVLLSEERWNERKCPIGVPLYATPISG